MLRAWYAAQARAHGWSRDGLALRIDSRLHERARVAPSPTPPARSRCRGPTSRSIS